MKKLAYLTLALMLLGALAGCGNGNVTSSPSLAPDSNVSPMVSTTPGDELMPDADDGTGAGTENGTGTGTPEGGTAPEGGAQTSPAA